jgi:hypothetical protein
VSLISKLSQHNLAYMIGAEVLGTNLPRIALTRTPQERLDVFTDEAASSVGFFGGGLLLDKWLEKHFAQSFAAGGNAARWARLGKTFGVGSTLAGFLVGVSFLRNYVTAQVNKTSQFSQIIQPQAGVTDSRLSQEKTKALWLSGLSLAAGLLGSLAAVMMTHRQIKGQIPWDTLNQLPVNGLMRKGMQGFHHLLGKRSPFGTPLKTGKLRLADFLDNRFLFGGKAFLNNPAKRQFLDLTNPAAFAFWVLPTYTGYFTGARSHLERMEALIKFLNFTGSFFFLPPFMEKSLLPAIQRTFPKLGKDGMEDVQFLVKQGVGIGSLVATTMGYQALSARLLKKPGITPQSNTASVLASPVFAKFNHPQ